MKGKLFSLIKIVLPLLFGIFFIWYFFASMSEEALTFFYKAIQEANYFWIILSLFLSVLSLFLRAYRWKYTLETLGYKTPFWNRYHSMMIGYLVNMTIPRAGEATRAGMLLRSDNVPFAKSFGTIIAERAIDLIMLALVTGISILLSYNDFFEIFNQIEQKFSGSASSSEYSLKFWVYLIGGVLVLTLIVFLIILPKLRTLAVNFIKSVISGVLSIFKCKNPVLFLLHTLGIWILYIVYFGIAFLSMKETTHFPLEGILLGFIAGAVGISFTNGGIGVFPFLVGLVVTFYLKDSNDNALAIGNALGMLIWVSQTILLIFLGLISLILIPKKYEKPISS